MEKTIWHQLAERVKSAEDNIRSRCAEIIANEVSMLVEDTGIIVSGISIKLTNVPSIASIEDDYKPSESDVKLNIVCEPRVDTSAL
jgi:hypothetical protein